MMPATRHSRLLSANRELRNFLERIDALAHGTSDIDAGELRAIGRLMKSMTPEISETSSSVPVDAAFQAQVREYIGNLRTLQATLEQVRCVMLARRARIEAARQHVDGLQNWANAYQQTA